MSDAPGCLFDVDGTLLDTNYLHVLAWSRAFRDTGHAGVDMASVHQALGLSSGELVERLLGHEDDATVEAHSARFAQLRDEARAFSGAGELVAAVADLGRRPVLTTSAKQQDLEWMLPLIGAGDALAGVVSSADVERSKPAPDILEEAVREHRLDPVRTVVVGDAVWDVQAARNAGLPCIGLGCGGIAGSALREAGAAEVYDGPRHLLAELGGSLLATG